MANLKGSNFERQIYDAMYRTEARGTPRVGCKPTNRVFSLCALKLA